MSKTLRNYWNNEKKKRRSKRLRNMAKTLHRNNNTNVSPNNWPNNHRNRTRRNGLHSPKRNNSMRSNNWGKTPKSNE